MEREAQDTDAARRVIGTQPDGPTPLEWYPNATAGFGNFLHGWAGNAAVLGKKNGWWIEAAIVACGLSIYWLGSGRAGVDKAPASAAVILIAWLHVVFG